MGYLTHDPVAMPAGTLEDFAEFERRTGRFVKPLDFTCVDRRAWRDPEFRDVTGERSADACPHCAIPPRWQSS